MCGSRTELASIAVCREREREREREWKTRNVQLSSTPKIYPRHVVAKMCGMMEWLYLLWICGVWEWPSTRWPLADCRLNLSTKEKTEKQCEIVCVYVSLLFCLVRHSVRLIGCLRKRITSEKPEGVISGRQEEECGDICYSKEIPRNTLISM